MITGYKNCTKCGKWRPVSDFSSTGLRLHSWCRTCVRLQKRKERAENPRRPLQTLSSGPLLKECNKMSTKAIAEAARVNERTVRYWKKGSRMRIGSADNLCVYLAIPLVWFTDD